jgi:hypothetical protein
MKIPPLGAELFHADRRKDGQTEGRTDTTKLIVAFRNFAHAPKSYTVIQKVCYTTYREFHALYFANQPTVMVVFS